MYFLNHIRHLARSRSIGIAMILLLVLQILPVAAFTSDSFPSNDMEHTVVLESHCMDMAGPNPDATDTMHDSNHMNQAETNCCEDCVCFLGSCSVSLVGSALNNPTTLSDSISSKVVNLYPSISLTTLLRPPTLA
jgi:hypothetical protein